MTPRQRQILGLLVLAGAAVVAARLIATRRTRAWNRHQRGRDPAHTEGREIDPKPGDILLFHHVARLRDILIVLVTRSPFYHAALYAGEMRVIEARPQGVIHNDLKGREQNFVVLPAPQAKGEAALAWAKCQLGARFDRGDFLIIFLEHIFTHWHINYTTPDMYTCAELVTAAFQQAGVELVPGKDPDEVAPADLARLLPPAAQPPASMTSSPDRMEGR